MGAYAGAARHRVHLATVILLAIVQADARPVMLISLDKTPPDATMKRVGAPSAWSIPRIPTRKNTMGGIPEGSRATCPHSPTSHRLGHWLLFV